MAPRFTNMFSFGHHQQQQQQQQHPPVQLQQQHQQKQPQYTVVQPPGKARAIKKGEQFEPLPFYDVLLSAPHYKFQTTANKAYIELKPRRSRMLNVQKEVKEPLHRILMTQQQQQQQAMNNNNDVMSIPMPTFWIGADKVRSENDYKPGTMKTFALGKKGSTCYTVYEATDQCIMNENYRNGKGMKRRNEMVEGELNLPQKQKQQQKQQTVRASDASVPRSVTATSSPTTPGITHSDTPPQPQPRLPSHQNMAGADQYRSVESDISMNTLDTHGIEAAVAGDAFDMDSMLDSSMLTVSMDAHRGSTGAAALRDTDEAAVADAMMMMSVETPPSGSAPTTSAFAAVPSGTGHSHLLDSSIGTWSGTAVPGQHPTSQACTTNNRMDTSTATASFSKMSVSSLTSKQPPPGSYAANYAFGATKSFQWLQDQFQRGQQKLDLSGQNLNDADAAAIAQLLATYNSNSSNSKIKMLCLSRNNIGDAGATQLAGIFQNQKDSVVTLPGLDLCDNRVGSAGATAIAQSLAASKLQVLDLGGNSIGANGAVAIATVLSTTKTRLRELRLSGNNIGDAGAEAMALAIETNSTMRTLHLSNNKITARGATLLANALTRTSTRLEALHLDFNNIGVDGARAIAGAITYPNNTTLEKLSLISCHIGPEGAAAVASALNTFSAMPRKLFLPSNNIGSRGALAMAAALQGNEALHTLDLRNNNIVLSSSNSSSTAGSSVAVEMKKALQHNKTLRRLDLSGNIVSDDGRNVEAEIQALMVGHSDDAK